VKSNLELGTLMSGQKFTLPLDLVTHTLAVIGIRGWGKTVAATVIAEEMCEAGLPWVALDPVSVWWGLRCKPDGTPGGYPIVIIGGPHGDLPLDAHSGARIAEAILQENLCCVIDLKMESKNNWRKFVADFCDRLMELNPAVPRHIFIEEAPEFVPQKPMGEQKRSLAAVDRLIRLGRNQGYGATLISQRYATIQKDVLTQCDSLLAGRMIGKSDRKASEEWIGEVAAELFPGKAADKFVKSLAGLPGGRGWFLSPQWENRFEEVQIRRRKTFHPGATREIGEAPVQVQLSDVHEFVERFGRVLKQKPAIPVRGVDTKPLPSRAGSKHQLYIPTPRDVAMEIESESVRLRSQVVDLTRQLGQANSIIANLRKQLEPEYRAYQALFGDIDKAIGGSQVDRGVWEPWMQKLGGRPGRMIEALLSRGELTRTQLATLTEQSPNSGSFATNLSTLNRNGLTMKEGDKIRLRPL
jgi:uncharacterized protein